MIKLGGSSTYGGYILVLIIITLPNNNNNNSSTTRRPLRNVARLRFKHAAFRQGECKQFRLIEQQQQQSRTATAYSGSWLCSMPQSDLKSFGCRTSPAAFLGALHSADGTDIYITAAMNLLAAASTHFFWLMRDVSVVIGYFLH